MKSNSYISKPPFLKATHTFILRSIGLFALSLFLSSASHAQISPCFANINWSIDPQNPLQINFCNASDFISGAYSFHFSWDLGDGYQETDSCFSHLYSTAGTYTICLSVQACDPNVGGACCTDDTCITIFIGGKGGGGGDEDTTTGVPTLSSAEVFGVFPNPVYQSAMIQYRLRINASVTISVFDVQGKRLYTRTNDEAEGHHEQLLSEEIFHGAGTYFVHFATDKGTHRALIISKE